MPAEPSATARSAFSTYLSQLNWPGRLDRTTELELMRRMHAGDAAARDEIARSLLPLMITIAKSFQGHDVELEDLIQEANLAMLTALADYDGRVRVSTFIYRCVMHRLMNLTNRAVRGRLLIQTATYVVEDAVDETSRYDFELIDVIELALCRVLPRDRFIFECRVSGWKYREIAEIVGLTTNRLGQIVREVTTAIMRELDPYL